MQDNLLLDRAIGDADVRHRVADHLRRPRRQPQLAGIRAAGVVQGQAGERPQRRIEPGGHALELGLLAVVQVAGLNVEGRIGLHGDLALLPLDPQHLQPRQGHLLPGVQGGQFAVDDHRRIAQHALLHEDLQDPPALTMSLFLDRPDPGRGKCHFRQTEIVGHGDLEAIDPALADVEGDPALQARLGGVELDARLGLGGHVGHGRRGAQPQQRRASWGSDRPRKAGSPARSPRSPDRR